MDARRILSAAIALVLLATSVAHGQRMFQADTPNFAVVAPDSHLASETARLAEHYRQQLAIQWLGHEIPQWRHRCPITVEISPHAGGETTFVFTGPPGTSEPTGWRMRIFGPPDRILDAVLPHEITHTIFATHYRQPLPRWADEGACTTVEHVSEREKIQKLLIQYLSVEPLKGIPFNRMFTMKQYPDDMLPLYAQSYSVARYLIMQRGHQHFVNFVGSGLDAEKMQNPLHAWDAAVREFYGFQDLSDLQLSWQDWVGKGSQEIALVTAPVGDDSGATRIAASLPVSAINAPVTPAAFQSNGTQPNSALFSGPMNFNNSQVPAPQFATGNQGLTPIEKLPADSWYRQQLSKPQPTTQNMSQPIPQSSHRIDTTIWR